jgi:pantetheine-phosphate adenylyltransferase
MKKAIFPGSFDPITLGHEEIVRRGATLFDEVIVAIGVNSAKHSAFTAEERVELIRTALADVPNLKVELYEGLTVAFAKLQGCQFLLRGLRNAADLEYERPIALMNRQISGGMETVFLISSGETSHISSTLVREVLKYGGPMDGLLSQPVIAAIQRMRA